MTKVGGTPSKTARLGGHGDEPEPVKGRTEKERIWRALVDRGVGQREAAKLARVSRWKVRNALAGWLASGWVVKKHGGGVKPTAKAPKDLRPGWADTPQGSPLHRQAPYAPTAGEPARIHRGKLKAQLARDVDPSALEWWEGSKPGANRVLYHRFVLPCKTSSGLVGVPVQVIQPRRLDRPHTLVVQSANVMARESALVELDHGGVLAWVRDAMQELVGSWLGQHAARCSPLEWTGLDREDLEVAYPARAAAQVGGDPQRDFAAVDKSDRFSPWDKEEEQNLTAYLRLRHLEGQVALLEAGEHTVADLLERILPSITEQLDGLRAAVKELHGSRSTGGARP